MHHHHESMNLSYGSLTKDHGIRQPRTHSNIPEFSNSGDIFSYTLQVSSQASPKYTGTSKRGTILHRESKKDTHVSLYVSFLKIPKTLTDFQQKRVLATCSNFSVSYLNLRKRASPVQQKQGLPNHASNRISHVLSLWKDNL